jgi:hypothetical protein
MKHWIYFIKDPEKYSWAFLQGCKYGQTKVVEFLWSAKSASIEKLMCLFCDVACKICTKYNSFCDSNCSGDLNINQVRKIKIIQYTHKRIKTNVRKLLNLEKDLEEKHRVHSNAFGKAYLINCRKINDPRWL